MAVRKRVKGDKFEFVIVIYKSEQNSPAPGKTESSDIYSDKKVKLSQYQNVKLMCRAAGVPFMFCYLTHYPGSLSERQSDCLILRANEMEVFFGPMWPLFISCRSTFSDTD